MLSPRRRADVFTASFPPAVGSIPEARHFLSDTIAARVSPDELGTALLLGSELATNAVVHADTPFVVGIEVGPTTLRVSVADDDASPPHLAPRDVTTPGGFGMFLVQELAARWGIEHHANGGKQVWFELALGHDPTTEPPA